MTTVVEKKNVYKGIAPCFPFWVKIVSQGTQSETRDHWKCAFFWYCTNTIFEVYAYFGFKGNQ